MEKKMDYTLRFWFKPRVATRQMGGIVVEIRCEGQPLPLKPMPTGIRCSRGEWVRTRRTFRGPRAEKLAARLAEFEAKLQRAKHQVEASGLPLRPDTIWQRYQKHAA